LNPFARTSCPWRRIPFPTNFCSFAQTTYNKLGVHSRLSHFCLRQTMLPRRLPYKVACCDDMLRHLGKLVLFLLAVASLIPQHSLLAQASKTSTTPPSASSSSLAPERAIALAGQGHCKESLPALKRAAAGSGPVETRKKAGVLALKCAMDLDDRSSATETLLLLHKQFPEDPEILFVSVHAYSDLSSKTALDLGRLAPQSVPARELNAEALEMQGKWDEAQREYQDILQAEPTAKGVHYLFGRLLLSKPSGDAAAIAQAKQEFQKELQVDPQNAGAEYILGEMARQESQWDDAIVHFSRAARLDTSFGDAFMGWGFCLVTLKRYEEAVPPLQMAVRLQEGNPAAHYNLAVALSRTGKKEEAEKEFAIHRRLTQKPAPAEEKKD
jgi:tetratricopeptide (TPR) repeat protein